jgi:hypothetical protein
VNCTFWRHFFRIFAVGFSDPQFFILAIINNIALYYYSKWIITYVGLLGASVSSQTLAYLKNFAPGTDARKYCTNSTELLDELALISKQNIWGNSERFMGACQSCGPDGGSLPPGYNMSQWACLEYVGAGSIQSDYQFWPGDLIKGDLSDTLHINAGFMYWFIFWAGVLMVLGLSQRVIGSLMVARLRVVLTQKIHKMIFHRKRKVLYRLIVLDRHLGFDNYDQRLCQDMQSMLDCVCAVIFGSLDITSMITSIWYFDVPR